jgi:hypothetical protein
MLSHSTANGATKRQLAEFDVMTALADSISSGKVRVLPRRNYPVRF